MSVNEVVITKEVVEKEGLLVEVVVQWSVVQLVFDILLNSVLLLTIN